MPYLRGYARRSPSRRRVRLLTPYRRSRRRADLDMILAIIVLILVVWLATSL